MMRINSMPARARFKNFKTTPLVSRAAGQAKLCVVFAWVCVRSKGRLNPGRRASHQSRWVPAAVGRKGNQER